MKVAHISDYNHKKQTGVPAMKTIFKASLVTLFLAGWAATGTGANAMALPSTDEHKCEPHVASVQYAKTRIGNLCLFKGNWVCYAEFTPNTDCDKSQPDAGLGEG
jgi:hypothetical protein